MAFCGIIIACTACAEAKREAAPAPVEILSAEEAAAIAVPPRTEPEVTGASTGAVAVADTPVELPAPKASAPAEAPEENVLTTNLTDGYWQVIFVLEGGKSREPYASQQGRFWRFHPEGVYQLFNADGTVFHEGTWSFERIDDKRNYVTLDALDGRHDNYYRTLMQTAYCTLVGTERFDNTDVQQRLRKLPAPPRLVTLN